MLELPIQKYRAEIKSAILHCGRVVIEAPPGSGKSTQIPQMILETGILNAGERVVILQPRRLAARLLALRVATERGSPVGGEVGYQVRFEDRTSHATRLVFVTEGILLRQMMRAQSLEGVGAVVFDEFHERNLYSDVCLARATEIQQKARPDLRIIVMSATLNTRQVSSYLGECRTVRCEGRSYPVEIEYLTKSPPADVPVWELAAEATVRGFDPEKGNALVFMPGAYEIQRTIQEVRSRLTSKIMVFPLHGELPAEQQDAAVAADGPPRVIVSTNVAETSLTIEGVTLVVDSGLARIAKHDPHRGINTLLVGKISRAAADQRAGRAGRTAPGRCLRLWTQSDHEKRAAFEIPEIRRVDLSEVLLALAAMGVVDVQNFPWFEKPEAAALGHAAELLEDLGAIRNGQLTPEGHQMLKYPVHPRYGRMFVEAKRIGCEHTAALLAALTQGRNILLRAETKDSRENREDLLQSGAISDFEVQARAWRYAVKNAYDPGRCRSLGIHASGCRQVTLLEAQFRSLLGANDQKQSTPPVSSLARCVLAGFADHVAARVDRGTLRCALTRGRRALLARDSVARDADLLVAAEIREIDGKDGPQTILSLATAIDVNILRELFRDDVHEQRTAFFDPQLKRVVAREDVRFRDLVVTRGRLTEPTQEEAARVMAEEVLSGRLAIESWDASVEQWIARLNCLADWMPELELPKIGPRERRELIAQICHGASNLRELRARPVWPIVRSWLNTQQSELLEKHAPAIINLPGGRKPRVLYSEGKQPKLAARIQDLYGVEKTFLIAGGRVALQIEILAPNHRPVQVTQDLAHFWNESYPRIKQELQRRYPRHEWR